MAASVATGAVIRAQLQDLTERFDLLTGVYVPVQERLAVAGVQSAKIGAQVQVGTGFDAGSGPRAGDRLLFAEALAERARLVHEVRAPLAQALEHLPRVGGDRTRMSLLLLSLRLDELEGAVAFATATDDPVAVMQDSRKQLEINRLFRELAQLSAQEVAMQRQDVAQAGRRVEQLTIAVTLAGAGLALLAAIAVALTLRPLRRLSESVRSLAQGDWAQRIELGEVSASRDDEVTRLAREFNAMAAALKERERALMQGERLAAVGQMAAQITHEIRNPLSSIALNVELLGDELSSSDAEGAALVHKIQNEIDRLTTITEGYLALTRRPRAELRRVDVGEVLRSLLEFLQESHRHAGIQAVLEADDDDAPHWALADEDQLRRLFLNLLQNAREAMESARESPAAGEGRAPDPAASPSAARRGEADARAPRITVKLALRERLVVVEVADEGPGIPLPADQLERVFEPFFTAKASGTGLGLLTVQQIAQDHGGHVRILRTGAAGTTFEVTLPACQP